MIYGKVSTFYNVQITSWEVLQVYRLQGCAPVGEVVLVQSLGGGGRVVVVHQRALHSVGRRHAENRILWISCFYDSSSEESLRDICYSDSWLVFTRNWYTCPQRLRGVFVISRDKHLKFRCRQFTGLVCKMILKKFFGLSKKMCINSLAYREICRKAGVATFLYPDCTHLPQLSCLRCPTLLTMKTRPWGTPTAL